MAIPVARVHLKMAHTALPGLIPTPPKWKMLSSLLPSPCPWVAANLEKPLAKPGRADADERWDTRKTTPATSASSPPAKPGRADSVERWDAHKKAAIPAASSSSSSGTCSSSKLPIRRASSAERWDVHKKRCPPQAELLDDGENSSIGSNDIEAEEEEIVWKPRAMYAGPGFVIAAPQASMIPMPISLLVPVA